MTLLIRFFDLFGGIGGFRLGLEKANEHLPKRAYERTNNECKRTDENASIRNNRLFRCVGYCDFDKRATAVYNQRFNENHAPTDARELDDSNLPEFDLLCAGFPCQPFSLAGKRRAFDDEERGTLFHEIARILEVRKPDFVLLENVKGLLSAQRGYCFAFILARLDELGYDCEWEVLNSKNFGVPQNRERVFIFGSRKRGGEQVFPLGQSGSVLEKENGGERGSGSRVCSTLDGRYGALRGQGETYLIEDRRQSGELRVKSEVNVNAHYGSGGGNVPFVMNIPHGFNEGWIKKYPNLRAHGGATHNEILVSPCLTEAQGRQGSSKEFLSACEKINLSSGCLRRLTPRECERLQGFPDDWTRFERINGVVKEVADSPRYKMLGNAVTVNVVQAVGEQIIRVEDL